jgi:hypothetical protein
MRETLAGDLGRAATTGSAMRTDLLTHDVRSVEATDDEGGS